MSKAFKVGDRVAVYGGIPFSSRLVAEGHKGTVKEVAVSPHMSGGILVDFDSTEMDGSWYVFPKQCRRLKLVAKPPQAAEPRRVFIHQHALEKAPSGGHDGGVSIPAFRSHFSDYDVEFVEVVRKKK
jgi:hypothetical protein